jgi:predicted alpha/beta-hydrolase family hydrolase
MMFFLERGYRVVAHDRRGHGRSTQTATGNEMDTYAADVDALVEKLDLHDAIHIGHSTGGGEVARYVAQYGKGLVAKAILISSVPPIMVKSDKNSGGTPIEVFDQIREGTSKHRAQFYQDITLPFYGYNRSGATISQGVRDNWWRQGMMGGIKAHYDCIKAFSETDFTEDLRKIEVLTLVMQGEDDQIVPFADSGPLSAKLLKNSATKFYPGYPTACPRPTPNKSTQTYWSSSRHNAALVYNRALGMQNVREFREDSASAAAVRGFLHQPTGSGADCLILTHGAGANCNAPLLVALAEAFCTSGLLVLRCDLPFRQARPHGPPPRGSAGGDQQGLRAAIASMQRETSGRIFLSGHSYGGRQSSMLAASEPGLADCLLLLSYPLHPPQRPTEMRTVHFSSLSTPALFVHGTRDGFGSIPEMETALRLIPARTELLPVTGAGHELMTKRNRDDVTRAVAEAFRLFAVDKAA